MYLLLILLPKSPASIVCTQWPWSRGHGWSCWCCCDCITWAAVVCLQLWLVLTALYALTLPKKTSEIHTHTDHPVFPIRRGRYVEWVLGTQCSVSTNMSVQCTHKSPACIQCYTLHLVTVTIIPNVGVDIQNLRCISSYFFVRWVGWYTYPYEG